MLAPGSSQFLSLQRLARSFSLLREAASSSVTKQAEKDAVASESNIGDTERTSLLELATELGPCALPLVGRRLHDGTDAEAEWAIELLLELACHKDSQLAPRVVELLRETLAAADIPSTQKASQFPSETARMLSIAVLTELEQELPLEATDYDAQTIHDRSVEELARHLTTARDVARAADHIARELEAGDMLELVDSLCQLKGHHAEPLVNELLARDDLQERVRTELARIAAPIRDRRARTPASSGRRPRTLAQIGRKKGLPPILVVSQHISGSKPRRRRGLCCALTSDGALADAIYRDDFTPCGVQRELVAPLEREGFVFHDADLSKVRNRLAIGAYKAHVSGHRLGSAYFLGRDMLGLFDEHITERRRAVNRDITTPLLARAIDLLHAGQPDRARPLLERHRKLAPHDASGAATLGSCILAQLDRAPDATDTAGDLFAAIEQLAHATALAPREAESHWNLAAAHHIATQRDSCAGTAAGHEASCYLALRNYLELADEHLDPVHQRDTARSALSLYERRARLDCPELTVAACSADARQDDAIRDYARTEVLLAEAADFTARGMRSDALISLRRAVRATPGHAGAWFSLAQYYTVSKRYEKARRAYQRSLELCPDNQEAIANLASIPRTIVEKPRNAETHAPSATERALPSEATPLHP